MGKEILATYLDQMCMGCANRCNNGECGITFVGHSGQIARMKRGFCSDARVYSLPKGKFTLPYPHKAISKRLESGDWVMDVIS